MSGANISIPDNKKSRRALNRVLARQPQVRAATTRVALGMAATATALLAAEADGQGRHHIEVTTAPPRHSDGVVELVGPGAMAVEFGRPEDSKRGAMAPKHILTRALGSAKL